MIIQLDRNLGSVVGLFLLDKIFNDHGRSLAGCMAFNASPTGNWQQLTANPLIVEQLNYSPEAERLDLENRLPFLNPEQCVTFDQIIASVEGNEGKLFLLNGPGGTGKTFVCIIQSVPTSVANRELPSSSFVIRYSQSFDANFCCRSNLRTQPSVVECASRVASSSSHSRPR